MSLDFYLKCDCCKTSLFSANITHNLNVIAEKCGLYNILWHPEVLDVLYAADIIYFLEQGLKKLQKNKEFYKQFEAKNGYGTYEDFVCFVEKVLDGCKTYPTGIITVSR